MFWENSVLKGYFHGNVFVLGKPRLNISYLNMRKNCFPLSKMPAGCLSWFCTGFDISASVETTWQSCVALDHVYFWNETKHSSYSFTLVIKIIEKRNSKSSTFPYWFQIMILIQVSYFKRSWQSSIQSRNMNINAWGSGPRIFGLTDGSTNSVPYTDILNIYKATC